MQTTTIEFWRDHSPEVGHDPQPALLHLAPAVPGIPLRENLPCKLQPAFRMRPEPRLQRGRFQDDIGHQHHWPQSHGLAQQTVREVTLRLRAAGAALGPADEMGTDNQARIQLPGSFQRDAEGGQAR